MRMDVDGRRSIGPAAVAWIALVVRAYFLVASELRHDARPAQADEPVDVLADGMLQPILPHGPPALHLT